jgi:hypothetical protein
MEKDFQNVMDKAKALFPPKETTGHRHAAGSGQVDIPAFLNHYDVAFKAKTNGSKTIYMLDHCLFDTSHAAGDSAIIQMADGTIGYHCFHNSCQGKDWKAARQAISGNDSMKPFTIGAVSSGTKPGTQKAGDDCSFTLPPQWPNRINQKAFTGIAGKFVELATRNSEADPAPVLLTFLIRYGVEIGSNAILYVGDSRHYPRTSAVIVGASSKARKGTSGKPVTRAFRFEYLPDNEHIIPASTSPGPLSTGEGLIYAVRDEVRAFKTDKAGNTEEVVVDPGVEDKRLFVLDEEFGGVLAVTKREGNTLSSTIRAIWDNGDLEPLIKNNRTRATGAHIGVVSHITLQELNRRLDETEAFNGFGNRFLWVCARRQKLVPFPEPMPEAELRAIQREMKQVIDKARQIDRMKLTDGAKRLWGNVYKDLSKENSGLVGAVINRAEAQVIRLSMIYALLEGEHMIDDMHIESALAVWEYCESSARFIFSGRDVDPNVNKLFSLVKEQGKIEATDVYKHFQNHITKEKMQKVIGELVSQQRIIVEQIQTGGRPRTIFKIYQCEESEKSPQKLDWDF